MTPSIKQFVLSKTMIFNALSLIILILSLPEVAQIIPTSVIPYEAAIVAVVNMILRTYTTMPLASKTGLND